MSGESTNNPSVTSPGSIIDAKVKYRLGFPSPLPPYKTPHYIPSKDIPGEMIMDAVISSLHQRKVDFHSICIVSRQASAVLLEPRPTVRIAAPCVEDDSWYLLLRDIDEFLIRNFSLLGQHICVEICDPMAFRLPAHFPIDKDHPIVAVWEDLVQDIVEIVGITSQWSSICAVRRGFDTIVVNNPVTIIVTSKYPALLEAYGATIRFRCRDYRLQEIDVAFVEVDDGFRSVEDGRSFPVVDELFMGAGVGPSNDPEATGTLGGTLTMTNGDTKHVVGFTSFHVVAVGNAMDQVCIPNEPANPAIPLVSPSNYDFNREVDITQQALEQAQETLAVFTNTHGTAEPDDRRQNKKNKMEAAITQFQNEVEKLNNFDRRAGTLWAGSGFGSRNADDNVIMNWALISLPDHRHFSNTLPSAAEFEALQPSMKFLPYLFPDSNQVEAFSHYAGDMLLVFKKGRSTGLTMGTMTALRPRVNINGRVARAWHVVGRSGGRGRGRAFADKGDEGAWVIDQEGRCVGFLFSSCAEMSCGGDAYVMPADGVVGDIEQVTGWSVSLA
ncbi:hypothetical protein FQN51_007978 [Onygenales sp. PD_10]|nr:hypothetical protein FQN51_007978 [Onygenales sp. PD_10]